MAKNLRRFKELFTVTECNFGPNPTNAAQVGFNLRLQTPYRVFITAHLTPELLKSLLLQGGWNCMDALAHLTADQAVSIVSSLRVDGQITDDEFSALETFAPDEIAQAIEALKASRKKNAGGN